jgi:hypothetical protein
MTSLTDTISTSIGIDTITLNNDGSSIWSGPMFDTITLSDYVTSSTASGIYSGSMLGTAPYTISNSVNTITGVPTNGTYSYNGSGDSWGYTHNGKPFVDNFPEWNAFRKLCDEYPGLEKAYQNLKTFYTMCYADSILPKDDK